MADSGWKDGSEARVETKALVSDFYLQFKNKENENSDFHFGGYCYVLSKFCAISEGLVNH